MSPRVLPLSRKGLRGFSQSHHSLLVFNTQLCFAVTAVCAAWTGLARLKTLFVSFLQLGVACLSVFVVKSFHSAQQFHSPTMSQPDKGGVSAALELKNEKLFFLSFFFRSIFPVHLFSLRIQRDSSFRCDHLHQKSAHDPSLLSMGCWIQGGRHAKVNAAPETLFISF